MNSGEEQGTSSVMDFVDGPKLDKFIALSSKMQTSLTVEQRPHHGPTEGAKGSTTRNNCRDKK